MAYERTKTPSVTTERCAMFSDDKLFHILFWNGAVIFKIEQMTTTFDGKRQVVKNSDVRAITSVDVAANFLITARETIKKALEDGEEKFVATKCSRSCLLSLETRRTSEGTLIPFIGVYQNLGQDCKPEKYYRFPLNREFEYFDNYDPENGILGKSLKVEGSNRTIDFIADAVISHERQYISNVHSTKKAMLDNNTSYGISKISEKMGIPTNVNTYQGTRYNDNNNSGSFDGKDSLQMTSISQADMSSNFLALE